MKRKASSGGSPLFDGLASGTGASPIGNSQLQLQARHGTPMGGSSGGNTSGLASSGQHGSSASSVNSASSAGNASGYGSSSGNISGGSNRQPSQGGSGRGGGGGGSEEDRRRRREQRGGEGNSRDESVESVNSGGDNRGYKRAKQRSPRTMGTSVAGASVPAPVAPTVVPVGMNTQQAAESGWTRVPGVSRWGQSSGGSQAAAPAAAAAAGAAAATAVAEVGQTRRDTAISSFGEGVSGRSLRLIRWRSRLWYAVLSAAKDNNDQGLPSLMDGQDASRRGYKTFVGSVALGSATQSNMGLVQSMWNQFCRRSKVTNLNRRDYVLVPNSTMIPSRDAFGLLRMDTLSLFSTRSADDRACCRSIQGDAPTAYETAVLAAGGYLPRLQQQLTRRLLNTMIHLEPMGGKPSGGSHCGYPRK